MESHEIENARREGCQGGAWTELQRRLMGLGPDRLIATARRRTGLADFGDPPVETPLAVLASSLESEARLSLFGRIATRQHLVEILQSRLRLADLWKRNRQTADRGVSKPVFITGMPRSGTTFLHALLAQDPANRAPTHWEVMFPLPLPGDLGRNRDRRIGAAERRLRWADRLAPKLKQLHPLGAQEPQECVAITAYSLLSTQFDEMYRVPTYQDWLRGQDLRPAYQFHRRFLSHLQGVTPPGRWVLKAPSHLLFLDALFAVYGDAFVVQTHRDPVRVLGSVATLGKTLQRLFSSRVDPVEVGAEVCRTLEAEITRVVEFRDRNPHLADRFCDIHYQDLARHPMQAVARIYARFGLDLSGEAEARMERFLADARTRRGDRRNYRLDRFGLDPATEQRRFAPYLQRFAIAAETP